MELITKEDLHLFKMQLLQEIREIISAGAKGEQELGKWLRSKEVKGILKVSDSTLQNMRISGTLSCKKIGGIYYYKLTEIEKLLK